jgi:Uma2 family endonuclease
VEKVELVIQIHVAAIPCTELSHAFQFRNPNSEMSFRSLGRWADPLPQPLIFSFHLSLLTSHFSQVGVDPFIRGGRLIGMARAVEIPKKEVYTYDDYAKLPEGAPYQLIGGKLVMTPAPSTHHQDIAKKLLVRLFSLEEKGLGKVFHAPIDVYFEETETYQPDIIFISRERLDIIEEERIRGAPDLVIEILSPSTAYYDLRKKFKVYERHGVREYWVVDPEARSITRYENRGGSLIQVEEVEERGRVGSELLPGLELDIESLW